MDTMQRNLFVNLITLLTMVATGLVVETCRAAAIPF